MKGVTAQLAVAGQVLQGAEHPGECQLVGGPASPNRCNPLVDDAGNLLPAALPEPPPVEGWGRDPGPLQPDEVWLGPMRVRVRLASETGLPQ